ncbi:hypothetical protein A8C56_17375 [Niabella ginsenosidivorans]|uniref:Uncharacterized protein n=1 Tax=Niabella ginsenosidivorans TaxID=1176587 RepID=A0A1A9I4F6_9BACT|nr:hypothetical protein [Niabella ginsenosidivorans]ANH82506.1 hypothetical protein A8C56_17375 [Niabella ginsenosidivorans]
MPITNLISQHLPAENLKAAQDAVDQLETAISSLAVNLTPNDRRKYGSINEQNKLFVNKVADYASAQPALRSAEVDWEEFTKDHQSRIELETMIAKLNNVVNRLNDAKTLYDYDNYQAALTDYAYTSYKAGSSAPGFEVKLNELKQFFAKPRNGAEPPVPAAS